MCFLLGKSLIFKYLDELSLQRMKREVGATHEISCISNRAYAAGNGRRNYRANASLFLILYGINVDWSLLGGSSVTHKLNPIGKSPVR
jgi:hypothetical protein